MKVSNLMKEKKIPKKKKKKEVKKKKPRKKRAKKVAKDCVFCYQETPTGTLSYKIKRLYQFDVGENRKKTIFYHKICYFLSEGREIKDIENDNVK